MRASRRGEIADERTDQAAFVDAIVLIKTFVLGRDECLLHVLRDVGEWNPDPPLVLLEHLREAFAPAVEHDARARKLHALELGMIGQVGGSLVVEVDDLAEVHGRHRDVLVLAELPVSRLQIGKIDSAEHLIVADRQWIVQGGCNQILKIDLLNVEGLAHMRTARVQQLRDLFLVSHAIKARPHGVWCSRDLTERESRGEDFDEDRFHHADLEGIF